MSVGNGDGFVPPDAATLSDLAVATLPDLAPNTAPLGSESTLYAPANLMNEQLAYNRVIRLAHAGAANGTLLATFEHTNADMTPVDLIVRSSADDGVTWSTLASLSDGETGPGRPTYAMWQPFLFELPKAMGNYPEGTLLLTANVIGTNQTHFQLWRSRDTGKHWSYVGMYQAGAGGGSGIWEPFFDIDNDGNLICYFSDERQSAQYSQVLAHIISADGGDTWSTTPVRDVASATQTDRPGMASVAKLADGTRVMSFEVCGTARGACEVHVKSSSDGGHTWGSGPADLGTFVQTTDGRYLGSSPYIVFDPANGGRLLLSAMRTRLVSDNSFALEDYQSVFINTRGGQGAWNWMPAPAMVWHGPGGQGSCYTNYSPHLLVSLEGGAVRYTAPSEDSAHSCAERTAIANSGALPYSSPFTVGTDAGWKSYGGCWSVANGIYSDGCGQTNGNKSIAGSTGWTDYTLSGDVRLNVGGSNAGFLVRVSDPAIGIDAHHGYFVGVGGGVFLGREDNNWTQLASSPVAGGIVSGTWYHLTVSASGCHFNVSVAPAAGGATPTTLTLDDPGCANTSGAIGVRDFGGGASFRDIAVTP